MQRSEPDLPAIDTPLAHETRILEQHVQDREPASISRRETNLPRSPSHHVIAILGPRPDATDPKLSAWEQAVDAVDQYRADYNIDPDDRVLLGPEPVAGAFQQRHDRRQAAATVLDVLNQLERPGVHRGPVRERPRTTAEVIGEESRRHHPNGWER